MTNKELKIAYTEYDSIEQLDLQDQLTAKAAIEAISGSYAPYSGFNVGAAVLLEDGEIIYGANQENAAYPSGLCAERTALFYAGANRKDKAVTSIAIAASQNGRLCDYPASPCGACRQVMAQTQTRSGKPLSTILVGAKKLMKFEKVDDLLPFIFDGRLDIWGDKLTAKTRGWTFRVMEGQQSSARTAFGPSRPQRLICSSRRSYIPAAVPRVSNDV